MRQEMKVGRRQYYLMLGLVILLLPLAACGGRSGGSESSARAREPKGSSQALATEFTASTGPSSSFSLSDHPGEVVILYFSFPG